MILTATPFHAAYRVAGLAASVHFFTGVYAILLPPLYFAKDMHALTWIQSAAAVVAILLNLALIPAFGFLGAGISYSAGFAVMAVLTMAWNLANRRQYIKVDYPWIRLSFFIPVFLAYSALTMWERNLSLGAEMSLAVAAALPLPLIVYGLLNGNGPGHATSWRGSRKRHAP
jgi:O-antigen/teichoic acid export membrane protein